MNVGLSPDDQFVVSFCTGGGGLDLGLRLALPAARVVAYVEVDAYACGVLVSRLEAGDLDAAPLWSDLKTFDSDSFSGCVDGVIGGYPCQPFSIAGRRTGTADDRHLWPFVAMHLERMEPSWCFFENVAHHLRLGFDEVARDLQRLGYRVAAGLYRAAEVGAPHRRERLFILAATDTALAVRRRGDDVADADRRHPAGRSGGPAVATEGPPHDQSAGPSGVVADARGERPQGRERTGASSERDGTAASRPAAELRDAPVEHADGSGESGRLAFTGRQTVTRPERAVEKFPPGPGDVERWQRVLSERPWLAPALADGDCRRLAQLAQRYEQQTRDDDASHRRDALRSGTNGRGSLRRQDDEQTPTESELRGMAHGLAHRLDRLRILGNGVVPQQAALAFRELWHDLTRAYMTGP